LTDRQWAIIEPLVPGKAGDRGLSGADNRLFLDVILWLARGASPWRDLPPEPGNWRTVHSRFRRWTLSGVWESLFKALSADPDFEYVLVDATICKTHADATSQKGGLKLPVSGDPKAAGRQKSTPRLTLLDFLSVSRSRRGSGAIARRHAV
jgi:putative transposase